VDLADLASRAATRLAPQFQDARVTLIVNADTVLPVHVDPDRITQVLTNLLGNALLATPAAAPSRSPHVAPPGAVRSW
jgi:signal transduction histidine kinase